jgi:hypothetical protein
MHREREREKEKEDILEKFVCVYTRKRLVFYHIHTQTDRHKKRSDRPYKHKTRDKEYMYACVCFSRMYVCASH